MAEYELRLRFTAATDFQAWRLGHAWAETCAAEYGTREPSVMSATSIGWMRLTEDTMGVRLGLLATDAQDMGIYETPADGKATS